MDTEELAKEVSRLNVELTSWREQYYKMESELKKTREAAEDWRRIALALTTVLENQ